MNVAAALHVRVAERRRRSPSPCSGACSPRWPTSPGCGAARACAAWRRNYARVRPDLRRRGGPPAVPRRACAATCATSARRSPCRASRRSSSGRACAWRATTSTCGRAVDGGGAAVARAGPPRQLGPGRRVRLPVPRDRAHRRRTAQARRAVRGVRAVPRARSASRSSPCGNGDVLGALVRGAKEGRKLIPLLSDRDLTSTRHRGRPRSGTAPGSPPGPALLGLEAGVPVHAVGITYERLRGARRRAAGTPWGIVIHFHPPLPVPDAGLPRDEQARLLTQGWVDQLAADDRRAHPGLAHAAARVRRRPRPRPAAHGPSRRGRPDEGRPRRGHRTLRVGLVCPYSFDAPGGVQFHVRDLAQALQAAGHEVSVLAPSSDDTELPDVVTAAGRAVPVPYNGSVARLTFGPLTATRVRRWLEGGIGGRPFDIVHLHEPMVPSLSMLALWQADRAGGRHLPHLAGALAGAAGRLPAGAAVPGEDRRPDRRLRGRAPHPGGPPRRRRRRDPERRVHASVREQPPAARVDRDALRPDRRVPRPARRAAQGPGRPACRPSPRSSTGVPGTRFLVAGRGDGIAAETRELLGRASLVRRVPRRRSSDADKAALLASADLYVAPQTGGESFGIVLVEAMGAGAVVVASDLGAFQRVLDDGAAGRPVPHRRPRGPRRHRAGRCSPTPRDGTPTAPTPPSGSSGSTGPASPSRCSPSTRWRSPPTTRIAGDVVGRIMGLFPRRVGGDA